MNKFKDDLSYHQEKIQDIEEELDNVDGVKRELETKLEAMRQRVMACKMLSNG